MAPKQERTEILPVARYAVARRIASGQADYWDWATSLELAVLAQDDTGAAAALSHALTAVREPWELDTTTRNLRLIREARARRGEAAAWIAEIEAELQGEKGRRWSG